VALVTLHPAIQSMHGRMGNAVFVYRKGRQHVRPYVKGRNPKTEAQQKNRTAFARAVRQWQAMNTYQRFLWNREAAGANRSGYNLFLSYRLQDAGEMLPQKQQKAFVPAPLLLRTSTEPGPEQHRITGKPHPPPGLQGQKRLQTRSIGPAYHGKK
jgi:hypothetical protein